MARESVEAYAQFLDDAFSRYQSGTEQAARSAKLGARTLSETTTGLLGTATGAGGSTVEGAERAAEAAVFPIEGYGEMNVEEISERLDGLSVEELQLLRGLLDAVELSGVPFHAGNIPAASTGRYFATREAESPVKPLQGGLASVGPRAG